MLLVFLPYWKAPYEGDLVGGGEGSCIPASLDSVSPFAQWDLGSSMVASAQPLSWAKCRTSNSQSWGTREGGVSWLSSCCGCPRIGGSPRTRVPDHRQPRWDPTLGPEGLLDRQNRAVPQAPTWAPLPQPMGWRTWGAFESPAEVRTSTRNCVSSSLTTHPTMPMSGTTPLAPEYPSMAPWIVHTIQKSWLAFPAWGCPSGHLLLSGG